MLPTAAAETPPALAARPNREQRRRLFRNWKVTEAAARRYIHERRTTAHWQALSAERRAGLKATRLFMDATLGVGRPLGVVHGPPAGVV